MDVAPGMADNIELGRLRQHPGRRGLDQQFHQVKMG